MYKVVIGACFVCIAALVGLTVWGSGADADVDFVFNNGAEVHSFDIHRISWRGDIRIAYTLFEGLMAFHIEPPADGEKLGRVTVVPGVAERYEVSGDGRTYTFHLRDNARWSNGRPVTAEQFRWSWQRVMTPQTGSDYAGLMFVIRGAERYYKDLAAGRAASFDTVGVKAPDARTLVVELNAPTGYFLELTAFPPFMPAYPPLLEEHRRPGSKAVNGIATYDEAWTKPGTIVSNGPFVLAKREFKREMLLVKNPQYWDRAHVRFHRVRALVIEDVNTSLKAYQSGLCDWIDGVPRGAARALAELPVEKRPPDYQAVTAFGTYYYRFNCTDTAAGRANPLVDKRVRQALAMCVDKQDLVDNVTGQHEPVADHFVPPGLTVSDLAGKVYAYRAPKGLPRNVARAKELLTEAGYDGAALGEIRLMYNASNDHQAIAERLASVWKQDLGVTVVLDKRDKVAFGEALKTPKDKPWHIARSGWFGDYLDPSSFLTMFLTGDGNNDCGYSNPAVDAKLNAAAATGDQAARMRLMAEAEAIIIRDDPAIIPLYHYIDKFMVRPDVRGAWPNLMGTFVLKQVWLER